MAIECNPQIVVMTFCWDRILPDFLKDWMSLWVSYHTIKASGWKGECIPMVVEGSLLPAARNDGIRMALDQFPDLTHVLMVDSDTIGLRAHHILRLLEHDKPIVGGLINLKSDPHVPACYSPKDGYEDIIKESRRSEPGLLERKWVGSGCIFITREVLDNLQINPSQGEKVLPPVWFRTGRGERLTWKEDMEKEIGVRVEEIVSILERAGQENRSVQPDELAVPIYSSIMFGRGIWDDGQTLSEDVEFCTRAGILGLQTYVDCGMQLDHIGVRAYGMSDFLRMKGEGGGASSGGWAE